MSKHICPRCGGKRFATVAHITQTWQVDEDGEFERVVSDCDEVTHGPDDGNEWTCMECGETALVVDFSKSYIQACMENDAFIKTGRDYEREWNEKKNTQKSLRGFLGMTEAEFAAWSLRGEEIVPKIITCRKKNIEFSPCDNSNEAKFNDFIDLYKPGQYVYPSAVSRETKIDVKEVYLRCEECENLKPVFTWYCPGCQRSMFFESIGDIPENICCQNCDFEDEVDLAKDIRVIYKKIE